MKTQNLTKTSLENPLKESTDKPKLRIKVCGLRDAQQIRTIADLGVDYLGFIFYPPSPRDIGADWDDLQTTLAQLPQNTQKVGVFVNPKIETILELQKNSEEKVLTCIQLHGQENPDFCEAVQHLGYKILKVFSGNALPNQAVLDAYAPHIDYYLFDHRGKLPGGNGISFDWMALLQLDIKKPFLLSGGLKLESLEAILAFQNQWNAQRNPRLFHGIDINSGFEHAPADKNMEAVSLMVRMMN